MLTKVVAGVAAGYLAAAVSHRAVCGIVDMIDDERRERACRAVDPIVRAKIAVQWKLPELLRAVEDSVTPSLEWTTSPTLSRAAVAGSVALAVLTGNEKLLDTGSSVTQSDVDIVVTSPRTLTTLEATCISKMVVQRLRGKGIQAHLHGIRNTNSYDATMGIDAPVLENGFERLAACQTPVPPALHDADPFAVEITHVAELTFDRNSQSESPSESPSESQNSSPSSCAPVRLQLVFVKPDSVDDDAAKTVVRISDTRVAVVCASDDVDGSDRLSIVVPRRQRQALLGENALASPLRPHRKTKYELRGLRVPDPIDFCFSKTPSALLTPGWGTFRIDDGRIDDGWSTGSESADLVFRTPLA